MRSSIMNSARSLALTITGMITMTGLASSTALAAPPKNCDRCFAMVRIDGSIVQSRNLQSVSKLGVGLYRLDFKYQTRNCAFSATADTLTPGILPVFVHISLSRVTHRVVDVFVASVPNASLRDYPFSLVVTC